MEKSPEAFRTISEVADHLRTPAHVLRFWETRFPQIRPVKRAGGRRYYRPSDVALLAGIKKLLHDEGMTIRGVQKMLREQGVRHVISFAAGDEDLPMATYGTDEDAAIEAALADVYGTTDMDRAAIIAAPPPADVESAQIIALETALNRRAAQPEPAPEPPPVAAPAGGLPLFDAAPDHDRAPEVEDDSLAVRLRALRHAGGQMDATNPQLLALHRRLRDLRRRMADAARAARIGM